MKAFYHIKASLLAFAAMVACTEMEISEEPQDSTNNELLQELSITGKDFLFENATRSSVTIGESGASFTWDEDDVIGIFPDKGDQVSFAMDEGAGTQTATFSGGGWALKSSAKYAAYYPHVYENRNLTAIPVSYVGQTQDGNANTDHIGAYDFMAAGVSTPENGAVAFDMQHLGALVQLTITVSEPSTLTKVVLTSSTEFTETGTIDLTADTPAIIAVTQSNTFEIALNNVATTEANEDVIIYFMTAPIDLTDSELTATIHLADETTCEVELTGKNFQAGKAYKLAEKAEKTIDYIDEYGINQGKGIELDGIVWAPVNCGYHKDDFKYGKLYQWGRKYGQGFNYTEANFPIFVAGPAFTSEAEDENNADKFFYVLGNTNSAFSYWDFPSLRDVTLWNSGSEEEPIKTIYDPCPDGWRAPTENELKSLFKNKSPMESFGSIKGAWFTGNSPYNQDALSIFIPAAGRRDEYMTCQFRNERVICWSSKYSRYAYYTGNTSSENLIGGYSAYGQSVRCVKETEHDLHSLVVSQNSISIPSGSNSTKFVIESSDVAWSITTDNEDFIVIPSTGTGMAEVEVICHSSPKTQSNLYITTHAKRLSTDRQYVITINRERNDGICYIDDKGYNHGEGIAISGVIWAPINCGCEEMLSNTQRQGKGLYYQWGRKYGQGAADGSDGPISQVVQGPVAVVTGNSVSNANVFYKSSSNDWAMSSDKNLWNSSSQDNPLKTKYDPCPEGWRVPTSKEFTSLYENYLQGSKNGNLGIFCYGSEECSAYNPSVFLPSSDILSPSTGQLLSGTNLDVWGGSYWTSTRYDAGIYSISFGSYGPGKPHIATIADAAWGRKVRCVSEKSSLK